MKKIYINLSLQVCTLSLLFSCSILKAQTLFTAPTNTTVVGSALAGYSAAQIAPNSNSGAVSYTHTWQGTTNRRLSNFTVGTALYKLNAAQAPNQAIFRKNDASGNNTTHNSGALLAGQQATSWKDRQLFFAEGTVNTPSQTTTIVNSYPGTYNSATNLEQNEAFKQGYWNFGSDNTFCNLELNAAGAGAGNVTASNNERIDLLWNSGIPVTALNLTKAGIVLSFRGPAFDDPIKFAAIKALTGGSNIGGGTNYIYDDLFSFNNSWTTKSVNGGASSASASPTVIGNIATVVFRRNDTDGSLNDQLTATTNPTISNVLAAQNINAVFLTFADLGLTVGETFYGYSVMPTDAVPGAAPTSNQINSYLNNTFFPNNTNATDGGADMSALNGFFEASYNLSGNVFNDVNALINSTVDGTVINGTNTGAGILTGEVLYAHLVDANNVVIATAPISATGAYNFANVTIGTYTVVINTSSTPNIVASPPTGWNFTGENIGTSAGNDGTVNGSLSVTLSIADITNANFGIQRPPQSAFNLQPITGNPGGFNSATVPASAFQINNVGATPNTQDFDGGVVENIRITAFPANANSITINGTVYINGGTCPPATSCTAWPGAGVTIPYTNGTGPSQVISVDPIEGNLDVIIPFAAIDNAGTEDITPGSVTIPFKTISLSGTVFNDLNGNATTVGTPEGGEAVINGTNSGAGILTGATLYANLIDAAGKVIATVPIESNGTYNFPNVPQSTTGLTVQLSTNQGTIGIAKPATSLPSGWITTGENANGNQSGTADGANGEIPVVTSTTNVITQNFGINQVPESAVNAQVVGTNPGGTVNTTVNPLWFVTSNVGSNPNTQDYNGGTVNNIRLTAFPSNATSITVNGTTYLSTDPIWPANGGAGITIPYTPGSGPTQTISVDPIDGTVSVVIPFVAIDNAGKEDPTSGSVTLTYTSVLPIRLTSFVANPKANTVELVWVVSTETNVANYEIEYSTTRANFTSIGGKVATDSRIYNLVHTSPKQGLNYYRLKIIDKDGKISYSEVRTVNFGATSSNVRLYPIPAKDAINITVTGSMINQPATISILSVDGRLMYQQSTNTLSQTETINVSKLANGKYILRIVTNNKVVNTQIEVLR